MRLADVDGPLVGFSILVLILTVMLGWALGKPQPAVQGAPGVDVSERPTGWTLTAKGGTGAVVVCKRCKRELKPDQRFSGEIVVTAAGGEKFFDGCIGCLEDAVRLDDAVVFEREAMRRVRRP